MSWPHCMNYPSLNIASPRFFGLGLGSSLFQECPSGHFHLIPGLRCPLLQKDLRGTQGFSGLHRSLCHSPEVWRCSDFFTCMSPWLGLQQWGWACCFFACLYLVVWVCVSYRYACLCVSVTGCPCGSHPGCVQMCLF